MRQLGQRGVLVVAALAAAAVAVAVPAFAASLNLTSNKVTIFASCYLRTSADDVTLDQGSPWSNNGTSSDLFAQSKSGSANKRVLIQFSLTNCHIPTGAEIVTAKLALFITAAPAQSRTYEARRVTGS